MLVEGPLDAIAITLAGNGRYRGVASCGTALTPDHAALLAEHATPHPMAGPRVILAPDTDTPGLVAATRAHAVLTTAGLDPRLLTYTSPDAKDAADAHHAGTLTGDLARPAPPLAQLLIDQHLADHRHGLDQAWPETRTRLYRDVAALLAALPTRFDWNTLIHHTATHATPSDAQTDQDETDWIATGLYRTALAHAVGREREPSPSGRASYTDALADLQTELACAPGGDATRTPRTAALQELMETFAMPPATPPTWCVPATVSAELQIPVRTTTTTRRPNSQPTPPG